MALSGYIFEDYAAIASLLEDPYDEMYGPSPTLQLARQLAASFQCCVIIGFPYRQRTAIPSQSIVTSAAYDARDSALVSGNYAPHSDGCFNAAMIVDEHGTLLHVFKKHFNYEDDKRWAREGPGFQTITLPRIGKICIAICMDLNPYDFQAPFEAYELAKYCLREQVDVLVMPMAWLMSHIEEDHVVEDHLDEGPQESTINYWAHRMSPYLSESERSVILVTCNRTGSERTSKFAGSSCALRFSAGRRSDTSASSVSLIGAMSRREGVQIFRLE